MRKILSIIICVVLLGFLSVNAQTLQLTASSTQVDINDPLTLTVALQGGGGNAQVRVDGLDDFTVVGQSTSTVMQSINGKNETSAQLLLQLQPQEAGSFVVGPARISYNGEQISSNIIQITVTGEKLFVNGAPQGWQTPSTNTVSTVDATDTDGSLPAKTEGEVDTQAFPATWHLLLMALGAAILLGGLYYRMKADPIYSGEETTLDDGDDVPQLIRTKSVLQIPDVTDEQYLSKAMHWLREYVIACFPTELTKLKAHDQTQSSQQLLSMLEDAGSVEDVKTMHTIAKLFQLLEQGLYSPQAVDIDHIDTLLHSLPKQ